jgi:signal peptidase I
MIFVKRTIQTSFVLALGVCILLAVSRLSVMQVSSSSMENTLHDGDYLLIEKVSVASVSYWWRGPRPSRGQIIVFRSPANTHEIAVKRIIAIPGDRVSIQNGSVILNGAKLDEPYVRWAQGYGPSAYYWPTSANTLRPNDIQVPGGSYFVLGDNRAVSFDSRHFGPVPRNDVIGVVIMAQAIGKAKIIAAQASSSCGSIGVTRACVESSDVPRSGFHV